MGQMTTSLVVQFGSAGNGLLSMEIDQTLSGSQFFPGDTVPLWVFKTSNVTLALPIASAGAVSSSGSGTVSITEDITFANTSSGNLSHPASGTPTVKWLGTSLGAVTLQDEYILSASKSGVGIARITYNAPYEVYNLVSPATVAGSAVFSIVVVLTGNAV